MHSLRLPGVPPVAASFTRHRFDSDPFLFSLDVSSSRPLPAPFWASLPSPPMSGSPPLELPLEAPQIAGRRRKRSDTPIPRTPSPLSTPVAEATSTTAISESPAERHRGVLATAGPSIQPVIWPSPYPASGTNVFEAGTAATVASQAPSIFHSQYVAASTSLKGARKPKAHVPSACVNCKRKHLRCDDARPCHRCVLSGKEASCVDVQHKKRGRPPLKPDEGAPRTYSELGQSPEAGRPPAPHQGMLHADPHVYSYSHHRQTLAPREPFYSAPRQEDGEHPRAALAPSPLAFSASSSSWMAPGYTTASVIAPAPSTQRPLSSSSSLPSSQPPSPFYQIPSAGTSPEGPLNITHGCREGFGQPTPAYDFSHPVAPSYNLPSFRPPVLQHQTPLGGSRGIYTPQHSIAPELLLPPIRPAPPGTYTNPAMAQHQQRQAHHQQQQEREREGRTSARSAEDGSSRPPDSKRPRMSLGNIVNPRNA